MFEVCLFVGVGRRCGQASAFFVVVFLGGMSKGWCLLAAYSIRCAGRSTICSVQPPFLKFFFVLAVYFASFFASCRLFFIWDRVEPVKGCRGVGKKDMKLNDKLPRMSVDPETYEASVYGRRDGRANFDWSVATFDTMTHGTGFDWQGSSAAFNFVILFLARDFDVASTG